jgi:hypothetical protein
MAYNRSSPMSTNSGHSRRDLLGGALAAAAGSLLETAATFAAEAPATKAKLWIGAVTADITPTGSVALPRAASYCQKRGDFLI